MRPLRPHPPLGAGERPVQPARPLPPGAALWRATAPRPAPLDPTAPAVGGDEGPAPVWRSRRAQRRAPPAEARSEGWTDRPRPAPDRRGQGQSGPEAPTTAPTPQAQRWDTDDLQAPGGWQDPGDWRLRPWDMPEPAEDRETPGVAGPGADTAADGMPPPVPPARIAMLSELPAEGAQDLRAFVRPPAQPGHSTDIPDAHPEGPDASPTGRPAGKPRWRLRRRAPRPAPDVRDRAAAPRDPAPSRLAYRLHRLWLTPMVRLVVRVGLPAWALAMAVGLIAADPDRRAWLGAQWDGLRDGIAARPEFQVTGLTVTGASAPVEAALRAMVPQDWPVSSFGLDLPALRAEIEKLDAVGRAELRVGADRLLAVEVTERRPAAIWRHGDGLVLLDAEGYRVARLLARAGRPDLPLLAGAGAERAVPEALALMAAAAPLRGDLIGLMRMGERRWDVVLTGDRRILLPETGAMAALERVLAQDAAQELLSRDIVQVDMRLPQRPTVQMSEAAVEDFRQGRAGAASATGAGGAMR